MFLFSKFTLFYASKLTLNDWSFCWKIIPFVLVLSPLKVFCLTHVSCETGGERMEFGLPHSRKSYAWPAYWFPPSLTLHMAPLYLAFLFWLLNRELMNPLPTDPAASHSQSALSLSISSTARQKISLEAKWGNKAYSVTASAGERKTYCY